jgi:hypothetical protein
VTVTSGKNEMTAKDTLGRMPRIVREVTDDFDVRVHVSGEFTAEYQNAVLLAFANPDEYARMSCGSGRYRTKQVSTGFMARGVIAGGRHHRTKDTSKWLRMQRVDGARWREVRSADAVDANGSQPWGRAVDGSI